jgi:hypothetical protein
MQHFDVNVGHIDVDASENDEILLQRAKDHLPAVLKALGVKAAEEFWNEIQRGIGSSGMFSMNVSREQFIAEKSAEVARNTTPTEKESLIQTIFQQLKAAWGQKR